MCREKEYCLDNYYGFNGYLIFFFTCIIKLDLEYRKKWDHYVVKLDVIDKDPQSKSEVVQWITNYPVSTAKTILNYSGQEWLILVIFLYPLTM